MATCASLVLSFIWEGGPQSETRAQVAATTFVVGLASFLSWFVMVFNKDIAEHN